MTAPCQMGLVVQLALVDLMATTRSATGCVDELVVGHGSILQQSYLKVMNVKPSFAVLVLARDVHFHYIIGF